MYGLRAQQPLYALCGGQARAVPAYGSGVDLPKPLDALLAQAEGFMARGLRGVKVKIGRHDPREDEQRVAAVRNLIGDRIDLMLDANMTLEHRRGARERGRRLEQFGLYWYEEPTHPGGCRRHARLARELTVPIAIGESLHSAYEFQRYVDAQAVEVLEIDPVTNGGITASLQALRLAERGLAHYQQPLYRRAERASVVCLQQPGLLRETRLCP